MSFFRRSSWVLAAVFALGLVPWAKAADFTIELPPLPFPPKILSVTDTGAVLGQAMTVTVQARGQRKRRLDFGVSPPTNFCDEAVNPNPPLVNDAYLWYTNETTDELLANWTKVTMTKVNTPVDESGCDHEGAITEFSGQIPSSVFGTADHFIRYYVQVVDGRGNMASQTPDAEATNIAVGTTDLQTNPSQAAKAPVGSLLVTDPSGDTKGNVGQGISKPVVDLLGINVAAGAETVMMNIKIGGGPPSQPDGAEIEGFIGALINGDAVDSDPNDALYPDGTFALSTAFQEVLPDLVHAVWDGKCLTNVALTGGSTDELLNCDLYAGGAGTGMQEVDGVGYVNWLLKHSADGVSLFGANKNVEIVTATGQIDIGAAPGTSPFWITDYTAGVTYYNVHQSRKVTGDIPPPPPCSALAVTKSDAGATNTCTVGWKNNSGNPNMPGGGGYFLFRSTKANGGTTFGELSALNAAAVVAHGADGADSTYPDSGLAKDGAKYYYWCMPRDKDGRMRYPEPGPAPIKALCTHADCANFPGTAPFSPATSAISCQTDDSIPPSNPTEFSASTPTGVTEILTVRWKPGTNASDPSMISGGSYRIYRDDVLVGTKPFVASVVEYEFIDQNLTNNTAYNYKIIARDVGANDSAGGLTGTGTPTDRQPPPKPKNLNGLNQSTEQGAKAKVIWDYISEADEPGFSSYVVYRCKTSGRTEDLGNCSDGSVPLPAGTWTQMTCPGLDQRGTETAPPTCTDTTVLVDQNYWYVVTAKDNATVPNESTFPSSAFSATGYPYRAVKIKTKVFPDFIGPGKVRELTAVDTEEGKTCEVSFKMPTANKDASPFCANGGTQDYCTAGLTNVVGNEIAQYAAVADSVQPADTGVPSCGTSLNVGNLAAAETILKFKCSGLTNGTPYKIDVYGEDQKPTKGDFTGTAANCTPTDKLAPAAPTEAEGLAFTESSVAVGWKASAPEANGGFKLYVCVANPGAACTAFAAVDGLTLSPCSGLNLASKTYCFEDGTTFGATEGAAQKVFHYKVTAFDAALNESLLSESNEVLVDFSIPSADVQSCVASANGDAGDSVECSWTTYNNTKGAANLVVAYVKCESTSACNNANTAVNWKESTEVAVTVNTGIIAAGVIKDDGCYQFAVLGKVDAANKSNPLTANRLNACVPVKGPVVVVPTCTTGCVKLKVDLLAITKPTGTVPSVVFDLMKEDGSATCLKAAATATNGETMVEVDTALCPSTGNAKIVIKNIPAGYARTTANEYVCEKAKKLSDILDKTDVTVLCELATGKDGGDANGDGKINLQDLGVLKPEFGKTPDKADFNGDGKVDLKDLGVIKKFFNLSI